MKNLSRKILLSTMVVGLVAVSCSKDEIMAPEESQITAVSAKAKLKTLPKDGLAPSRLSLGDKVVTIKELTDGSSLVNAVNPSECGPTRFNKVLARYDKWLVNGFLSVWDGDPEAYFLIFGDYFAINQITAYYGFRNTDYFGAQGEYTKYVKQRTRSLERFWDMRGMVQVQGQHTATLEDLELIRFIYENFSDLSECEIDDIVDLAAEYNAASKQIPENPLFAFDAFASIGTEDGSLATRIIGTGVIVIGDGIVQALSEAGTRDNMVWNGVMAHEWGHQIQFLNYGTFDYPVEPFIGTPESTRMTELEADFFTGYFMTHKKGATHDWKSTRGFLKLFYNIGDCGFTSGGHHGTPLQRLAAAKSGYELGKENHSRKRNWKDKKRHSWNNGRDDVLSAAEVHEVFLEELDDILAGKGAMDDDDDDGYSHDNDRGRKK